MYKVGCIFWTGVKNE